MNWNLLQKVDQLDDLLTESSERKILIFKHSTRCSISNTMLARLERNWKDAEVNDLKPYFLDLLAYRPLSNAIAEAFNVEHQSPQVLIISKGRAIYDRSHFDIDFEQIRTAAKN
ncbi:MAG: bacillithiol system redox-active protein YtxJ [Cyclobacteriaceae bacterium]